LVTFINVPFVGMVKMTTTLTDSEFILEELDSQLTEKGETLFRTDSIQNVLFDGFSVRNYIDILEDPLVEMVVGKVEIPKSFHGGKFAIYKGKNGSDDGLYEVNTGRESYKNFGNIHKWNNSTKLRWWKGDCNNITGTDGTIFSPFLLRHHVLKCFSPELCRTLTMTHESDILFKEIPGFRFSPESHSFLGPHQYEPNRCFCTEKNDSTPCYRNGLMLLSNCKEGAPVSLSSPHFYNADSAIIDAIDGIHPVKEKHKTYLDIEPVKDHYIHICLGNLDMRL
ncbi:unnamed protein product, partial [Allacma fusca]